MKIFKPWLISAFIITGLCGLVYAAVQQNYRSSLNDPQIQIAQDVSRALADGADARTFIPQKTIDMSESLAPFMIVYDQGFKPITSSAILGKEAPVPPQGVFVTAKLQGENRLTWEPKPGVRIATVIKPYQGVNTGFVLVGRSMKEVENRIDNLTTLVGIVWMGLMIGSLLLQKVL